MRNPRMGGRLSCFAIPLGELKCKYLPKWRRGLKLLNHARNTQNQLHVRYFEHFRNFAGLYEAFGPHYSVNNTGGRNLNIITILKWLPYGGGTVHF
jgi:hypothetical protein